MYLTLGQVANNSFCDSYSYVFALFPAFHNLFTPPKTPSFPTGPATLIGILRVFCHLSLILEHKIRCFLVISLIFTRKVDAPVFFTYLQSVRTISKLQQSSHYESGFKTDGSQRRTKGILGLRENFGFYSSAICLTSS